MLLADMKIGMLLAGMMIGMLLAGEGITSKEYSLNHDSMSLWFGGLQLFQNEPAAIPKTKNMLRLSHCENETLLCMAGFRRNMSGPFVQAEKNEHFR